MWAVHGVHHAPNEQNYSVNLSQGALQRVTEAAFYAPLALFFSPQLYVLVYPMEKIYGFFTHTRLLNKMYLLEGLVVTPSSHRVHHAGAPSKYIDRNYGEMLSIWDRMFGTWQEEQEAIVFGHVHPISSWDPIRAQTVVWRDIFHKASSCSSLIDKVRLSVWLVGWVWSLSGCLTGLGACRSSAS
jgi:sterol desaturase/sphingolipid hydroxylase (fatty acid hydroxylase superfamily)